MPLDWSPSWLDFAKQYGLTVYDVSNRESVLTSITGGVPANAGDPVGMVLDVANGIVLGAEIVGVLPVPVATDGGAGSSAIWDAQSKTISVSNIGTSQSYPRTSFAFPTIQVGKLYKVRGKLSGNLAAVDNVRLALSGQTSDIILDKATGELSGISVAAIGQFQISLNGRLAPYSVKIESLSIKEIEFGNRIVAPSDAARPIMTRTPATGRRNLAVNTENFNQTATWQAGTGVSASGAFEAPDGTLTAVKLSETSIDGDHMLVGAFGTLATSTRYRMSVYVKAAERSVFMLERGYGGSNAETVQFDLANGTIGLVGFGGVELLKPEMVSVGNGWYRVSISLAAANNSLRCGFRLVDKIYNTVQASKPYQGIVGSGVLIWHPQVEISEITTPYQKVTSSYDVTEAGVRDTWSLTFDGVDDLLSSSVIAARKLPFYAGVSSFRSNTPDRKTIIALWSNGDNYAGILTSSNNLGSRTIGGLRTSVKGPTTVMLDANKAPINANECTDSSSIVGVTDVRYGNNFKVQGANNWLPEDVITGNKIQLFDPNLAGRFYRGIVINKDVLEVERGLINQWLKEGYSL